MKIRVTEIEACAEELRQSRSLGEALTEALRRGLNGPYASNVDDDDQEDEEEET